MVGGLRDLQNSAGLCDSLALANELVSRFELAYDLLGYVAGRFMLKSPPHSGRMRTLIQPGAFEDFKPVDYLYWEGSASSGI